MFDSYWGLRHGVTLVAGSVSGAEVRRVRGRRMGGVRFGEVRRGVGPPFPRQNAWTLSPTKLRYRISSANNCNTFVRRTAQGQTDKAQQFDR